jgi:adenylylsulfate kinase
VDWKGIEVKIYLTCESCQTVLTPKNRVDIEEFKGLCYTCYSKKPKHIYVDFDGVLAEYTGWKGPEYLGPPRPGCKEFLAELKSLGFTVVIFSTRRPGAIQVWLRTHELWHLVSKVTNEKGPALAYIDDRNICFEGDYGAVLWKLVRFTPYWKNKP